MDGCKCHYDSITSVDGLSHAINGPELWHAISGPRRRHKWSCTCAVVLKGATSTASEAGAGAESEDSVSVNDSEHDLVQKAYIYITEGTYPGGANAK